MNRTIRLRTAFFSVALLACGGGDAASQTEALCRVFVEERGSQSIGSGTLVYVTENSGEGLVLTCAHVIGPQPGRIVVEFPGRVRHVGRLVGIDKAADLAALAIGSPVVRPVEFSATTAPGQTVRACGFGGDGTPRCVRGEVVGQAVSSGQRSIVLQGAVRSGDSGGCVLDESDRLVAVVWGQSQGKTYATAGVPLQRFIRRLLPRCPPNVAQTPPGGCYGGSCPPPSSRPAVVAPRKPSPSRPLLDRLFVDRLEARLAAIEKNQSGFLTRDALKEFVSGEGAISAPDFSSLPWWFQEPRELIGSSLMPVAATTGLIGVAAALVYAGRRLWRRFGVYTPDHQPIAKEATAEAEAHFQHEAAPIERDDGEARQLLRLSQLEGRDPLQDALAGRLAIDRLDALAESDMDPQRAEWADRLRRELRERFNDVSPTKFPAVGAAAS